MTQPDLIGLYKHRANARLESAGFLLKNNPGCQFNTSPSAELSRSNIGMTIWSAAIDVGSVLMLQERGTEPTGRSPEISRFITRDLDQQHPHLTLSTAWSALVQLHNIQHRAGHERARFSTATRAAYRSLAILNYLLEKGNQIDPRSYGWLARVQQQYANPFRDETPRRWPRIEQAIINRPSPRLGTVPLHWAAENHDPEAVEKLIRAGAKVDATDYSGKTPLHTAGRSGPPKTVYALIRHGADLEKQDTIANAIHYAAAFNGCDTVEALIRAGADVNRRDINNETPLHWAARWQGDARVAETLITAGSRASSRSWTGHSPYDIAIASGSYFADRLIV